MILLGSVRGTRTRVELRTAKARIAPNGQVGSHDVPAFFYHWKPPKTNRRGEKAYDQGFFSSILP
jgi:hypothetical protein